MICILTCYDEMYFITRSRLYSAWIPPRNKPGVTVRRNDWIGEIYPHISLKSYKTINKA